MIEDRFVVHWANPERAMRVTATRGAFATCEWNDDGLPRRRVYPEAELVDAKAGRFDVVLAPPVVMHRVRGVWSDDDDDERGWP
jgi:hypothetical protein